MITIVCAQRRTTKGCWARGTGGT